ncbi:sulfite exporter TauE/SafE family protein [Candidatus Saccharibacteria bacterium]|nr:sulfite exporter TauE/SafE family protein [Candidatus Saccharibacteria bacterium]
MLENIIILLVGVLVGAINAIAGGGMLIGFPVLLATGMPPIVANATSYLVVQPGNIAALITYRDYLRKIPRQYLFLLVPTVFGAVVGTHLLRNTSPDEFASFIPLLIVFAVLLFAYQPFLYRYLHKHIHGSPMLRRRVKPLFLVGIAMIPLSIYGGYFGAGFGFIMLAFLGFTRLHEHIHRMNALKVVTVSVLTFVSLLLLLGSGLIDWRHGLIMATGNLAGGYFGARQSKKISGHAIRVFIVCIGFATATYLAFRSY